MEAANSLFVCVYQALTLRLCWTLEHCNDGCSRPYQSSFDNWRWWHVLRKIFALRCGSVSVFSATVRCGNLRDLEHKSSLIFFIMPMGLACKEFTSNCLYQFPMYWVVSFHVIFKGITIQSLCQPAFVGQFTFEFVLANSHQLLTWKDTLKSCVCVMLVLISISSRCIIMKLMANWSWSSDWTVHGTVWL